MDASVSIPPVLCSGCNNVIRENARYCHKCGQKSVGVNQFHPAFNDSLKFVFAYYFVSLGLIVLLKATDFQTNTVTALISDALFVCLTLGFVFQNFKEIKPLFSFSNVKTKIVLLLIAAEVVFAVGVNSFTQFINEVLLNSPDTRYYYLYLDSGYPVLMTLFSISLIPGIFEELGFRGVLFNHLSKITSSQSVIIVTSALFAVIHLSLISLIWILPMGFLFAYLRHRYKTIWYGIIGHSVYNATIVMIELLQDGMLF